RQRSGFFKKLIRMPSCGAVLEGEECLRRRVTPPRQECGWLLPGTGVIVMPRHPVGSLSPLIALIISISFWVGLGGSAALLGVIILSPRWLEVERTQADYVRNARVIRDLRKENDHLDRMAHAL